MGDPLFVDGLDLAIVLFVLLKAVVGFVFLLVAVIFMVWFERKVIADMQNRVGPNRAGPWGILQTLADGTKLFFKEDVLPDRADRPVFRLAPYLSIVPAFATFASCPSAALHLAGRHVRCSTRPAAAGRPAHRGPLPAGHVVDRRLRGDAGRLVVGLQVPAAGRGAGVGPDGVLRGGPGPGGGGRGAAQPGRSPPTTSSPPRPGCSTGTSSPRRGALRGVPDRGLRRGQPAAVRPGGGRAGAGGRVPHRVLVDPVRPVLPGRVHEHGHHSAIIVTLFFGGPAGPVSRPCHPVADRVVLRQAARVPLHLCLAAGDPAPVPLRPAHGPRWKKLIPVSLFWLLLVAALRIGRREGWNWAVVLAGGVPVGGLGWLALAAALRLGQSDDADLSDAQLGAKRPSGRRSADGLPRRVQGHPQGDVRGTGHQRVPERQARRSRALPRPPRPQPLRGRHGEVHRLRAVRRCVPRPLHLRPGRRQPARRPRVARRALRLRLRDQLPPLHPLRPVRGGVPHRGHHRVEALRVLLHQPAGRHLHQGRAAGRRRRPAPAPPVGGLAGRRRPAHLGWMRATSPSGDAAFEGRVRGRASSATACATPSRARRPSQARPRRLPASAGAP